MNISAFIHHWDIRINLALRSAGGEVVCGKAGETEKRGIFAPNNFSLGNLRTQISFLPFLLSYFLSFYIFL